MESSLTNSEGLPKRSLKSNKSLPDLLFACAKDSPNKEFCRYKRSPDQNWQRQTWSGFADEVRKLANFLKGKLGPEDKAAAIISASRREWMLADFAVQSLGLASVSVYQTLTPDQISYIIEDSGASVVFVENISQYDKLTQTPKVVLSFEDVPGVMSVEDALKESSSDFELPELKGEHIASVVYTSGTTGEPKGVVQSHQNHLEMLQSVLNSDLVGTAERVFLYLPLAHSFARLIGYAPLIGPGSLIFPTIVDKKKSLFDATQVFEDIKTSGTYYFPSVPRLYEKVMTKLQGTLGIPVLGAVFTKTPFGRKFIRNKIFGPDFRFGISGGAPLGFEVGEFFNKVGIKIYEGYGLTETTPAISANTLHFNKPGSVGRPLDCNVVRIAPEDGEILVKGSNVFSEYLGKEEATREAFTEDGWFRTGDIGKLDEDGFLFITDRKKDLIVSAGGKNIAPALTESKIKNSRYVSQAVVYGDKRPYLVALITLEVEQVEKWAKSQNIELKRYSESDELYNLIIGEMETLCKSLAGYERVKRFRILDEDFSIEAGELTPSLKVKRKVIVEKYKQLFEELYE